MPSANAYLDDVPAGETERTYPLHALVCEACFLVQLEAFVSPEDLFTDYAYLSSYSDSWVDHAGRFAQRAAADLRLDPSDLVIEVGSNDGYLLKHFVALGIPVLGIEPAANVARLAIEDGIQTECRFFGMDTATELAEKGVRASLLVANNVLAHVPDLHDFVGGLSVALRPDGYLSIEVPHLLRLIEDTQFDTIYHEHFSYFSLLTLERALAEHGLSVIHVEQIPTHGGSLRIWSRLASAQVSASPEVEAVHHLERTARLERIETYTGFELRVDRCRRDAIGFLANARTEGRTVVAYGAAAKGNTFLNYCGVSTSDISFVADRSPTKQGRLLPGSLLPVEPPERIFEARPDFVVILPWNLRHEIATQLAEIGEWGGQFVTFIPKLRIFA
jgi:SAM-dependent methyltransferase